MLTKTDIKIIKGLLKPFATKDDLQKELEPIKKDLINVKKDMGRVKASTAFTEKAVVNILDWTQDIHESIVQEKLPERVKQLEHLLKTS